MTYNILYSNWYFVPKLWMCQSPWNGQLVDVDAFSPTLHVAERRWVVAPLTVVTGPLVFRSK